jgi:nicotinate-nucleotide adenylyltransferase
MKYIFFGGAFDPVHVDHLSKAKQVLDKTGYESLFFMPTYQHVWGKKTADANHRKLMLRAAINDFGDERIWLSLVEIVHKMSGPTIETLERLFKESVYIRGGATPSNSAYLIGMDQALVMDSWERWEELINLLPFIVMSRGQEPVEEIAEFGVDWFLKPPHQYVKVTGTGVASARIRLDIKRGKLNPDRLTPSTLAYIKEHGLYV